MPSVTDAFRFVARPQFTTRRDAMDVAAWRHLIQLLFTVALIVIVLSGVVGGIVQSALGELPENALEDIAISNPAQFILFGIVIAPVMEELMFRSWLGLPRGTLLGLPALMCVLTALTALNADADGQWVLPMLALIAFLFFLLVRQANDVGPGRRAEATRRLFPFIFWATAVMFGIIHLSNYEGGVLAGLRQPVLLLAVLPQTLVGLALGYVRIRYGLIPAIGFHAAYNSLFIALVLIGQSVADAPAVWLLP